MHLLLGGQIDATGWAIVVTGWAFAHPVGMLEEALPRMLTFAKTGALRVPRHHSRSLLTHLHTLILPTHRNPTSASARSRARFKLVWRPAAWKPTVEHGLLGLHYVPNIFPTRFL